MVGRDFAPDGLVFGIIVNGRIVQISGSVIDVAFPEGNLPKIREALTVSTDIFIYRSYRKICNILIIPNFLRFEKSFFQKLSY